jgi:hypothetical protein
VRVIIASGAATTFARESFHSQARCKHYTNSSRRLKTKACSRNTEDEFNSVQLALQNRSTVQHVGYSVCIIGHIRLLNCSQRIDGTFQFDKYETFRKMSTSWRVMPACEYTNQKRHHCVPATQPDSLGNHTSHALYMPQVIKQKLLPLTSH